MEIAGIFYFDFQMSSKQICEQILKSGYVKLWWSPVIENKCTLNVGILHLCKADYYHNSFDGYRGNVVGGSGASTSPRELALRS